MELQKVKIKMEAIQLERSIISFIDGHSQEIRRITIKVGVKCVFLFTPTTTRTSNSTKDQLPVESVTPAVYAIRCEMCEYVGYP